MKRVLFSIYILAALAGASGLYGIGEKTLVVGSALGWGVFETASGLALFPDSRPNPVLALSSANSPDAAVDGHLSFDEGSPDRFRDSAGHYDVIASPDMGAAGTPWVRNGQGAARFSSSAAISLRNSSYDESSGPGGAFRAEAGALVLVPRRNATFAPGSHIRDFSFEFWLCPANPVNGEQILSWTSTLTDGGDLVYQNIRCVVSRNRLEWTFANFFAAPDGTIPETAKTVTLTGTPLLPRTWSHHLVRFNAEYGLLEYLVDGRQEALAYVTSPGREGGDVYTPLTGEDCAFTLGSRFTGFIDEFRVYPQCRNEPVLAKYLPRGGRAESRTLDLGAINTRLLRIEATGGRISGADAKSEYASPGVFRFGDHSEIRFYIRFSDFAHQWNESWIPVAAGAALPETFRGRYVQIAVELFPSGDGESTPYLEEIRLVYRGIAPPAPPSLVTAIPRDGAVELSWRGVADSNLGGYLVYFGTSGGEYFGEGGFSSPLDVGSRTSVRIEGLANGTLYYFAVASYDKGYGEPGEFSRETAARPLREFQAR